MTEKKRVVLIHWKESEIPERISRLAKAGYEAAPFVMRGPASLRTLRDEAPAAVVIDLSRTPSMGREVGGAIRRQAGTRSLPLVFVDGEPEKVEQVRKLLPDATYAAWRDIRSALREALRNPGKDLVVPGAFDAYAGTPLNKKLGLKVGISVLLVKAPRGFASLLEPLPEGVVVRTRGASPANLVIFFARSRADLERGFAAVSRAVAPGGSIWFCWPKLGSAEAGDLSQPVVRRIGLDGGLVDYKVPSIDATWTGLRFAPRAARTGPAGGPRSARSHQP